MGSAGKPLDKAQENRQRLARSTGSCPPDASASPGHRLCSLSCPCPGGGIMKHDLVRIVDRPDLIDLAVRWFHEKWGILEEACRQSMRESLSRQKPVPQWYVLLLEDGIWGREIVAGAGVMENTFTPARAWKPGNRSMPSLPWAVRWGRASITQSPCLPKTLPASSRRVS